METLQSPLTMAQARARLKEGRLVVVVAIDFSELIEMGGIDGLNDYVDDHVLTGGVLTDIGYKVVGHVAGTDTSEGQVLVEVNADPQEY